MKTPPVAHDLEVAATAAAEQQTPAAKKVVEEEDSRLRWAFVRKVYGILSLQFALTRSSSSSSPRSSSCSPCSSTGRSTPGTSSCSPCSRSAAASVSLCPRPPLSDIGNYQYMMEDMAVLPDITFLRLTVMANGHAFEASAFHVLRLSTGIRRLVLQLVATVSEAQTVCSSDCICLQRVEWETEELLLNHLKEVEITGWRGTEHEVDFVKRLFDWGTKLKEMTICFPLGRVANWP
ncbi:uncharacterized protein [Miscanthus floridulus]|uniref:uncharacterized protein n=1 Tax=Miscanthus floridulus TaxID=154761 RepID=UPI00345A2B37